MVYSISQAPGSFGVVGGVGGGTLIAPIGANLAGSIAGIAFDPSGQLWGASNFNGTSVVYSISQAPGSFGLVDGVGGGTLLAPIGANLAGSIAGIAFDPSGQLWGASNFNGTSVVYSISQAPGSFGVVDGVGGGTLLAPIGANLAGSIADIAFAPDISAPPGDGGVGGAVPEPSEWALMLMGLSALGAVLRHRRRSLLPA